MKYLIALIVPAVFLAAGCRSDFELIERADGSKARLLRDIDSAWPLFAEKTTFTFKPKLELPQATMTKLEADIELKREVEKLYQDLDQFNALMRNILVWYYLVYQTAELDNQPTRDQFRMLWLQIGPRLAEQAVKLQSEINKTVKEATGTGRSEFSAKTVEEIQKSISESQKSVVSTVEELTRTYVTPPLAPRNPG